ncbi:MAG: cobalamin B12-binding domain-containing protein [Solirubrobacterales bacterium]|nr:cobalamin B12-binding domain-containing protein [Solirubrobacterales bacterium]
MSSDTLRVWERRYRLLNPRRTTGNIRLYSAVDEARVRLMTRSLGEGVPAAQAAELARAARLTLRPGTTGQVLEHDGAAAARRMSAALDAFDESGAEQALQQLLSEYAPLAVIRDVVVPYLHEVGERWAAAHMTVAQEHFASNFLHSRLLALARGWDCGLGPHALLACSPDELHTLGLICFGVALHSHGWKITYLGAATPVEMVSDVASRLRPDLITVSVSVTGRLEPVLAQLADLAAQWPLAIGGPATDARAAARCRALHLAGDPVTAAASIAAAGAWPAGLCPPVGLRPPVRSRAGRDGGERAAESRSVTSAVTTRGTSD